MEPGWKQGTDLLSIHHEPGTLEITSLYTIPILFILYFGHFHADLVKTKWQLTTVFFLENPMDRGAWRIRLSTDTC